MGEAEKGTDGSLNKVGMESQIEEAGCIWCAQDTTRKWCGHSTSTQGRVEVRPEVRPEMGPERRGSRPFRTLSAL